MRKIFLIFQLFSVYLCFGQDVELPVIDVYQSDCDIHTDIARVQERIIFQKLANDTLTIAFGTVENCAGIHDVKCYINCDTIKFDYEVGIIEIDTAANGEIITDFSVAACDCCFEFIFTVTGITYSPKVAKLLNRILNFYPEKYKVYPVKFDIVGSDTVNYVDKFGLKQGKWVKPDWEQNEKDSVFFDGYYVDNKIKSSICKIYNKNKILIYYDTHFDYKMTERIRYFDNGEISGQWIGYNDASFISYSYFPNKLLARVVFENKNFREDTEYYDNGNLKKIVNTFTYKEFYEDGSIKIENFDSKCSGKIWRKIYYNNGKVMAVYSRTGLSGVRRVRSVTKKRNGEGKLVKTVHWTEVSRGNPRYKYYDINGKRVSREYLWEKGFEDILN